MLSDFMEKAGWFFTVLIVMVLVFFLAVQSSLMIRLMSGSNYAIPSLSEGNIAVLELQGGIFKIQDKLERLKQLKDRDSIKGLLLDIDSPGGLVGPSQELSNAIARFAEEKPVVASVRSLGASGAYYAASSADTIVVNPGGMVGSIGVVMEFFNVQDLSKKVGIDYQVIKSGEYKDIGSPFREMSDEERAILKNVIMDVYDQFLDHIIEHRDEFDRSELEKMADGRIFTGRQAKEKGLVDITGGRHEAIEILSKAAGIEGEPQLVEPSKDRFSLTELESLFNNFLGQFLPGSRNRVRLLYMMENWDGISHG